MSCKLESNTQLTSGLQHILTDFSNNLLSAISDKIEDNNKIMRKLLINMKNEILEEIHPSVNNVNYLKSTVNNDLQSFEEHIDSITDFNVKDFFDIFSKSDDTISLNNVQEFDMELEDLFFGDELKPINNEAKALVKSKINVYQKIDANDKNNNVYKKNFPLKKKCNMIKVLQRNMKYLKKSSEKLHKKIDLLPVKIDKSNTSYALIGSDNTCDDFNENVFPEDEEIGQCSNTIDLVKRGTGAIRKRINKPCFISSEEKLDAGNEELREMLKMVANTLEVEYDDKNICLISKPRSIIINFRHEQELNKWRESARKKLVEENFSYKELLELDEMNVIANLEEFQCPICLSTIKVNEGVTLHECGHSFCRECIVDTVTHSNEMEIKCPCRDGDYSCHGVFQERELKEIVPTEIYDKYLVRNINMFASSQQNTVFCNTPDCQNFYIMDNDDEITEFICMICKHVNCIPCQAVHTGKNCREYQNDLRVQSINNEQAKATLQMFQEMIDKKVAMHCPKCHIVIMKTEGCDWIQCSMCRTEICWATFGPRWGPLGKGDTSGGCQCRISDGMRCHPNCNYCH